MTDSIELYRTYVEARLENCLGIAARGLAEGESLETLHKLDNIVTLSQRVSVRSLLKGCAIATITFLITFLKNRH